MDVVVTPDTATSHEASNELPQSLQTMIDVGRQSVQAVRDLQSTLVASMDMSNRFGSGGTRAVVTPSGSSGAGNPLAGQTMGAAGIAASMGSGVAVTSVEATRARALSYMSQHGLGGAGMAQARAATPAAAFTAGQTGPPGGQPTAGQRVAAAAGIPIGGAGAAGAGGGGQGGGGMGGAVAGGGGGAPGFVIGTPGITSALHKLPGVGFAMDAFSEYQSQINKNNYYRNIEGGGQGNAFRERASEEAYTYSSMRLFSNAEARQAFKGVTRTGYTDQSDKLAGAQTRSDALNFVYQGKSDRGQSVDEGLSQVSAASKSLEVNLGTLSKTLDDVSKSAGAAGVNTAMARQQMMGYMSQGIARGQGGGSTAFASALEQTNVGYGRDYAQNVSSSGIYSNSMEYRAAAATGQTAGALRNLERTNPSAAMQAFGVATTQALSAVVTPAMQQYITQLITQYGGAAAIKAQPDYADQIAQQFLDRFGGSMDPNAFTNVIQQLSGQNFNGDITMAARWVVEQVAGNTAQATAQANQGQAGLTNLSGKSLTTGAQNAGVTGSLSSVVTDSRVTHRFGTDEQSNAAKQYVGAAAKSGQRDPVIEALLKNSNLQGDAGNSQHVQVIAKGGNRIVSLADAIKYFPNEIAAGKVQFVDGSAKGKSVQDLAGMVDSTRSYSAESTSATGSKIGVAASDFGKSVGTATQVLGLTPEASALVKILPQTSSAGAGTPPVNPNGLTASR